MQTPQTGNLKERIAALQQRSVSSPQHGQQPSQHSSSASKPSSPANSPGGSLRSKIAKFESKGGVPIPRGSFGLGAPPENGQNASRELYGNRIPGVNRPSGSVSRSGSPLPGVDTSPGAAEGRKRRVSTGAFDGSLDLAGVTQRLAYQRNLDILNGVTPTDTPVSPGTDRSLSPSDTPGNDSIPTSPRRKSMQVLGASRRSVSSMDVFSKYGTQPEYIVRSLSSSPLRNAQSITDEQDTQRAAPSIVISPESSSSPSIIEGSQIVDEPIEAASDDPVPSSGSKPASPSSPKVPSLTVGNATSGKSRSPTIDRSPITSPVSPAPMDRAVQPVGIAGLEHPPDSPYLEFAKPSSPPASPPMKVQPVIRKVTSGSPSKSKSKTDVVRPTRSSSLAPAVRTSRSPSPTPSMIHRPESAGAGEPRAVITSLKARTTSSDKLGRRTIVALPANPLPAPDNDESNVTYGSVTLGSHSETNLLNPVHKTKTGFSAVVHRKVTENSQSSPSSDARSVRSVPNMTSYTRRAVGLMPPTSPGYGDLAALLAEAALLEERLTQGESFGDVTNDVDRMGDLDTLSQPASSVERSRTPDTYDDEIQDQVPPPPPPKGFPRMLSNLRKLTGSGTLRSTHSSHSRVSTSGSEISSEDSASVVTPSDNGIPFPGSYSNGSLDRPGSSGSSALGIGYPSKSPKKNGGSMNRATSFADKIWPRSRTKSNNSNTPGMCQHR